MCFLSVFKSLDSLDLVFGVLKFALKIVGILRLKGFMVAMVFEPPSARLWQVLQEISAEFAYSLVN